MSSPKPSLYEWIIIAYNQDQTMEAVATFNSSASDIFLKRGEVLKSLREDGFSNVVWIKGNFVREHRVDFDKISKFPTSRKQVYIYFYFIDLNSNLEKSFCRITEIGEFDKNLLSNIEVIRKNLRWQFKSYEVKEYFDPKRIKFILKRHFS